MSVVAQQIVMANRSRTPTHDELAKQVTDLAGEAVASEAVDVNTGTSLEANIADLAAKLFNFTAKSSVGRTLDTVFQVSATAPALVLYTIELNVTFSLLANDTIGVTLLCDGDNPPTTVHGRSFIYANQTLGLGTSINQIQRQQLFTYVPAGHYVKLVTAGTGTATINNQLELLFDG